MSNDKYQLCPCGSGKKLKFCCYETHRTLDQLSDEELLRRASEFRVYESRVNSNWQEAGIARTCLALQRDAEQAISFLEQAAVLHPSPDIYYNLAGVHRSLLQIQPAVTSLRKVIELDGAKGEVGKRAKADLEALASSIRESSGLTLDRYFEDAERFDQAFRCLMEGHFEQAARGFNLVLESQPDHVQSHGNRTCLCWVGRSGCCDPAFGQGYRTGSGLRTGDRQQTCYPRDGAR